MFDLSFAELLLIVACALIFIGPRELPAVARALAKMARGWRAMAGELRAAFDDLAQDTGLKEAREEIERGVKRITGEDGKQYEVYDISHMQRERDS